MSKKKKSKGAKLDWATFCEDYGDTGPAKRSFTSRRGTGGALPTGPSGLPSGPGGAPAGGGRDGGRYGARGGGDRERRSYGAGREDDNAGRADGSSAWRRGGTGGGGGGGARRSYDTVERGSRTQGDRDAGGDREERDMGPSKADESRNWRSAKSAAPPRREMARRDPPPRRDPPKERDPPRFGSGPSRPATGGGDARGAGGGPDRDPPRFGSAARNRRESPERETQSRPARYQDRPPPRDDLDMGSFRNRSGPAAPRRDFGEGRDPPRRPMGGSRFGDRPMGGGRFGEAASDRREAPVFNKNAAEAWRKDQDRMEGGMDMQPRESTLCEGQAIIAAAPHNAWGGKANPVVGTIPKKRPQQTRQNDAPLRRPEPARQPPRRTTRFSGTPNGFGYELVQKLVQEGPSRGGGRLGGGQRPPANSRFARPADEEFRSRDARFGREDGGHGGLPGGPRNDRREGEVPNLGKRRAEARGPPSGPGGRGLPSGPGGGRGPPSGPGRGPSGPARRASPPASQNVEAFPSLPDAPKHVQLKAPVDTRKLDREAKKKKQREDAEKRRELEEDRKKQEQQNMLRSQDFVKALGEESGVNVEILASGLATISDHPDLTLNSTFKTLSSTLNFKVAVHDPDLPSRKIRELLSTSLAVTLIEKAADSVEIFGTLQKFVNNQETAASLAEETFKYIMKRKGETKLVALVEGLDVMQLLNAPEDRDDWDDFLEEKSLICLAPPEDFGEQVATALENNEPPSEILDILSEAEDGKIPPSTCKQIVVYLAGLYIKSDDTAEKFMDDSVMALFKKVAATEETQIMAINEIINRWYEAGKKKGQFILLVKGLHEKEILRSETLVEWKDQKGTKQKQQALLDNYEEQQIGGVEIVNMSDYVTKHDPANLRNKDEESESEEEDEVVNDYLGADPLNAHMANEALPDDDYGNWSD